MGLDLRSEPILSSTAHEAKSVLILPAESAQGVEGDKAAQDLGRRPGAPEAGAAEEGRQAEKAGSQNDKRANDRQKP